MLRMQVVMFNSSFLAGIRIVRELLNSFTEFSSGFLLRRRVIKLYSDINDIVVRREVARIFRISIMIKRGYIILVLILAFFGA